MSFDDWKECGSEAAVRAAGKLRMEGRKYEVQGESLRKLPARRQYVGIVFARLPPQSFAPNVRARRRRHLLLQSWPQLSRLT
jgi:hypothetical protein